MQKMSSLIIKDQIFLKHDPGFGHPESPERLRAIYNRLSHKDIKDFLVVKAPKKATREELAWNHSPQYIDRIAKTSGIDHYQLDPDTSTSADSWDTACFAVGGVFTALDEIFDGQLHTAFALIRPPGHHAEKDHAMGFCLFNNIALGAHYAIKVKRCQRVLIVDWDLHHGNGSQHSFYNNRQVLYFSTHQYPYYPGTGSAEETGEGEGEGFTINVPLGAGAGDKEYASIFNKLLEPVAIEFNPDLVLVSAGFDIYRDDPLGGMNVTVEGFFSLACKLIEISKKCADGRILFCLEGGYNLTGLKEGVAAVLRACTGTGKRDEKEIFEILNNADKEIIELKHAIRMQNRYWHGL